MAQSYHLPLGNPLFYADNILHFMKSSLVRIISYWRSVVGANGLSVSELLLDCYWTVTGAQIFP